ncbi:MAG TPA: SIS domain-containing protein, partial [Methanosarcinales archaeon]|nr:SIS domain-containing protein [Methanosarcinales archaeon]
CKRSILVDLVYVSCSMIISTPFRTRLFFTFLNVSSSCVEGVAACSSLFFVMVVAISGSGETMSIVDLGKVIKEIGATLIVVTSKPDSSLGRMADITVKIFGRSKDGGGDYLARHLLGQYAKLSELAPLGTTFEISTLVFLDAAIAELMTRMGKQSEDLEDMHDKLQ